MSPPRYDRIRIAHIALRLLDDVGLPDLSMRRLATELEVQPSALYWHFRSKQELLAAIADLILEGARPAGTDPVAIARSIQNALLAYRDGAEVVMSSYALGLGSSQARDLLRDAVGGDAALADALYEFILGHVTIVQQSLHAHSTGAADDGSPDPTARAQAVFERGLAAFAGRTVSA